MFVLGFEQNHITRPSMGNFGDAIMQTFTRRVRTFIRCDLEGYALVMLSVLLSLGVYFVRAASYDMNPHDFATRWGYGTYFILLAALSCLSVFALLGISHIIWLLSYTRRTRNFLA